MASVTSMSDQTLEVRIYFYGYHRVLIASLSSTLFPILRSDVKTNMLYVASYVLLLYALIHIRILLFQTYWYDT